MYPPAARGESMEVDMEEEKENTVPKKPLMYN